MKNIIIIGTNRLSVVIKRIIEVEKCANVVAFSTYKKFMSETFLDGIPVIATEDMDAIVKKENCEILITVGYSEMNQIRERVFNDIRSRGWAITSFISKNAIVYSSEIGLGSIVMPGAYIGPFVEIGKACFIMMHTTLTHTVKINDWCFIAADSVLGGFTEVGHHSFVGMNSTMRNKTCVAPYTLVGAGSNITHSVDVEESVVVGNPAKRLENKNSLNTKI